MANIISQEKRREKTILHLSLDTNILYLLFLQLGPYEPADYGADIEWEWNTRGDIEWITTVYRFYWALPLEEAYRAKGDEE